MAHKYEQGEEKIKKEEKKETRDGMAISNIFVKYNTLYFSFFTESDEIWELLDLEKVAAYCDAINLPYLRVESRSGFPCEHLLTIPVSLKQVTLMRDKFRKKRYFASSIVRFMRVEKPELAFFISRGFWPLLFKQIYTYTDPAKYIEDIVCTSQINRIKGIKLDE